MWIVHAMVVELCGVRCVRFVSNFRARLDRERAVLDLVGFVIDVSVHRVGRPRRHAAPAPHAASPSARHRPYMYPIGRRRRGASEDERVIRRMTQLGAPPRERRSRCVTQQTREPQDELPYGRRGASTAVGGGCSGRGSYHGLYRTVRVRFYDRKLFRRG